ncbi:hypothetical protein ARMSODRAFT_662985 [Armillaria solidipes]|uniref:Uncharacterized protein n=1 Tax=Armillaria solidipes TaxID=1076256 RepID=A0A2H3AVH4_9AGAR|nr:hypothetical protein ARMSODRAFT_662985 [Armillaria solidipes]
MTIRSGASCGMHSGGVIFIIVSIVIECGRSQDFTISIHASRRRTLGEYTSLGLRARVLIWPRIPHRTCTRLRSSRDITGADVSSCDGTATDFDDTILLIRINIRTSQPLISSTMATT